MDRDPRFRVSVAPIRLQHNSSPQYRVEWVLMHRMVLHLHRRLVSRELPVLPQVG